MINGLGRKEDSFLIGFVLESLFLGAITLKDAEQWVYNLIKEYDNLPSYIYTLPEAESKTEFEKLIGFSTSSDISSKEMKALIGISYIRGISTDDTEWNISKKTALKALKDNPQVEKRFRETFPFIDF